MKMKTVEEHFKTLPDGYRERALANLPRGNVSEYETLMEAISYGFDWLESPEGEDFWFEVHNHFSRTIPTPLPDLPKVEKDPDGIDVHSPGAKLDSGKPKVVKGLLHQFPAACAAVAEVSEFGAEKYTWGGWKAVENGVERYGDAGARHIVKEIIEGPTDSDSGLLHKAHKAWNALAELELYLEETK
jgi:hypothetical protein